MSVKRSAYVVLLGVTLVALLAACGPAKATPQPTAVPATPIVQPTPVVVPTVQPTAPLVTGADLLDDVKAAGKLVVSTDPDYKPQSFLNDQGVLDGFDIDVAKEVAKRLGVEVEFTTPKWDLITVGNWSGRWDLSIGSMTPTEQRSEVLWFTDPYYYTPAVFAVHKDNTTITTVADLTGKKVGLGTATTYEDYLNGKLQMLGGEIMYDPPSGVEIVAYETDANAIQDLSLGDGVRLDAVMTSQTVVQSAIDSGVGLKYLGTPAFYEPLVFSLDRARGPSDKMIAELNGIVKAMHEDGTLTQLSQKWYGLDLTTIVQPSVVPQGGTFIFGRGADSVQLDPAIVTDGESLRVAGAVLESLYQYEAGSTKPIPALATGCTPNAEATEWVCTLRQNVKFQDGTPFNADAVIFNFERWRYTTNPYHYPSQVFEYYEAMWGGFDDASMITKLEKVDDYTIKFTLSASLAPFLANLAMDMFSISSPAAIEAAGENYGLPSVGCVGTGPFTFKEWVEGDHITIVANEDYWDGRPNVDEIIFRVIPDDSARYLALKAGEIHALEQTTSENVIAAATDPDLYILAKPALNTSYVAFNYKIVEFRDKNVREAAAHALNRKAIVDSFYGAGYGVVAKTFIPPLMWGYNDAIQDWTYDPELSKELLTKAGFPNGLSEVTLAEDIKDADGNVTYKAGDKIPLRFYYMPVTRPYQPSAKEVGEAMAADLTKAGFNVTMETTGDWPTYLGLRRTGQLVGFYQLGWMGDNGDPDNFLGYFFGGLSKAGEVKEPEMREGWYANQQVADLLFTAAVTPDQSKREPLYKQAEQLLHDDLARIWVGHNQSPIIFSKMVKGYVPQPVGTDIYDDVAIYK